MVVYTISQMFLKLLHLLLVILTQAQKEILLLKLKMDNYKESMNYTLAIWLYSTLYSFLMVKMDIELTYFTTLNHQAKKGREIVWQRDSGSLIGFSPGQMKHKLYCILGNYFNNSLLKLIPWLNKSGSATSKTTKRNLELTSIAAYKVHWILEQTKARLKEKESFYLQPLLGAHVTWINFILMVWQYVVMLVS